MPNCRWKKLKLRLTVTLDNDKVSHMSNNHTTHQHHVDLEAVCREHNISCTDQRKLIWEYFAQHPQGYSIAEAVAAFAEHGIGRATIYRTVELFERLHILTSIRDGVGKQRYCAVCPGHAHTLICQSCHVVVEFEDCDLTVLEKLLVANTGFTIQGHHLEMYGTCPSCACSI